ncbi:group II truncated hemoglobin [uncultured Piscinibacter sp.]|uniref:group II truncated hemoglobin n=1 Tax=uncultured Piscinibacter sp. TaxID=1131835 RepID=UPI00345C1A4E
MAGATGRQRRALAGGTAVALCHAMSALPIVPVTSNPHYQRLGGETAIARLVDAFYAAMDRREDARAIRAMHAPELAATKAVLRMYLGEWLGGPKRYSPERGPPRLRRMHAPFAIDTTARDAWLACMRDALQETCADEALRSELLAAFGKVADHLVNTASTHRSP